MADECARLRYGRAFRGRLPVNRLVTNRCLIRLTVCHFRCSAERERATDLRLQQRRRRGPVQRHHVAPASFRCRPFPARERDRVVRRDAERDEWKPRRCHVAATGV